MLATNVRDFNLNPLNLKVNKIHHVIMQLYKNIN